MSDSWLTWHATKLFHENWLCITVLLQGDIILIDVSHQRVSVQIVSSKLVIFAVPKTQHHFFSKNYGDLETLLRYCLQNIIPYWYVAISETESKDISRCPTDYNYADYIRSAGKIDIIPERRIYCKNDKRQWFQIAYQFTCKTDVQCMFEAMTSYLLTATALLKVYTVQLNIHTVRTMYILQWSTPIRSTLNITV